MQKRVFIASQLFDLATIPLMNVQQQVQQVLDNLTGGRIQFQIQQVSDNELELTFHRGFNYSPTIGGGMIYALDAEIITGQALPVLPTLQKFSNLINFYIPVGDFLQGYKQSAAALKASRAKNIQLNIQPTKVVMKLTY